MQSSIINSKDTSKHAVEEYRFKVLGSHEPSETIVSTQIYDENYDCKKEDIDNEVNTTQDSLETIMNNEVQNFSEKSYIEDLIKKTDELSNNIIKLQMKIEKQQEDFEKKLQEETKKNEKAFIRQGHEEARIEFESRVEEIRLKYNHSFELLNNENNKLQEFLKTTESELPLTAIEIAKEVIKTEVQENSAKIALNLAKELIKKLIDATKIEIKVNSKDYPFIKESLQGADNIKISQDKAISEGGIVIFSDVGNLDGNLSTRLEEIKHMANG